MNSIPLKTLATACALAFAGAVSAQTTVSGSSSGITTAAGGGGTSAVYLKRTDTRFGGFTGSTENTDSLASGLRTGGEITLTGNGETATFTPPTRPMGYGNVTRAMDLAQRDLAAAGITDPTPTEIKIAMMGGTITRTDGTVTTTTNFDGVLKLRAEGMGWGQIAHTIGVHPGMGKSSTLTTPPATSSSTSTSTSTTTASGGTTAGGGKSGIVTAAGGSGFSAAHGNGRALGLSAGASSGATTTAAGAGAAAGGVTSAKGNGNAFGRGK
jgi:hypothetical protein